MKMVKKILLGMSVAALVIGMTSCNGFTIGGDDTVSGDVINGTTTKAYVGTNENNGYTNSTDGWVREMQLFSTKHYGAFAALTLTGENKNQAAGNSNGLLGYVFNYTENQNGTVNFATIGYRWYGQKLQSYISQFYNIDKTKFSANNFDCTATRNSYDATVTTPYEIEILKGATTTYSDLGTWAVMNDDGTSTIGIEVVAETDGSYKVNYYGPSKLTTAYKLKADQNPDKIVPISTSITGYSAKKQTKMGCYVNVYTNKTLKGFWRFSSIKGEDIPVEGFEKE